MSQRLYDFDEYFNEDKVWDMTQGYRDFLIDNGGSLVQGMREWKLWSQKKEDEFMELPADEYDW